MRRTLDKTNKVSVVPFLNLELQKACTISLTSNSRSVSTYTWHSKRLKLNHLNLTLTKRKFVSQHTHYLPSPSPPFGGAVGLAVVATVVGAEGNKYSLNRVHKL